MLTIAAEVEIYLNLVMCIIWFWPEFLMILRIFLQVGNVPRNGV